MISFLYKSLFVNSLALNACHIPMLPLLICMDNLEETCSYSYIFSSVDFHIRSFILKNLSYGDSSLIF